MRILIPAVFSLLLVPGPAVAQDFFQSFEEFVEEMLPERQAPRAAPEREPVEAMTPTPIEQRPHEVGVVEEPEASGGTTPLPRPRPEEDVPEVVEDEAIEPDSVTPARDEAPVSHPEPARIYQTACPALLSGLIVGEMLEPIEEGLCGERSPLSVTAVMANGRRVPLSSPVTTNCQMAGALAAWVGAVDRYAGAALDSRVAAVTTGTSYMCRNRYSADYGLVSEHGFANGVDVVGFSLENGEAINVEADWLPASAPEGRMLRHAHGAACGHFTTVLGPEANAEHEDHIHLDLGCHGQSCTAQICE
ncbi:extensin family protein [Devosia sp. CAU 1758]